MNDDESSHWYDGIVEQATGAARDYAGQRLGLNQKPVSNPPAAAPKKIDWNKIALIGGAVAAVIGLVLMLRKK